MEQGRFPNSIRMYRRMYGYSQKRVASMFGFANTTMVSRWELGIAMPSVMQSYQLARLYNILPHELYPTLWAQQSGESIAVPRYQELTSTTMT